MKKIILGALLLSVVAYADTKISQLPLGTASGTATNDSFPYVDSIGGATKRLTLGDIINIPAVSTAFQPAGTYIKADGSVGLSANWNAGAHNITASTFIGNLTGNASGSAASFTGSLVGDVTGTQGATAISASTVTGKLITGFSSGAGSVSSSDSILSALDKLDGNTNGKVSQTTTVNGHALSSNVTVSASDVGLGNVTNDAQIKASIGTAKGDLIGFSASATPVHLAVGTNAFVLTADSAQTLGFKWAAAPTANFTSPTVTTYSGATSTTYTTPIGVLYLEFIVQAGGGSGAGAGIDAGPGGNGSTGGSASVGSIISCNGGSGGTAGSGAGSTGGSATISSPAYGDTAEGGSGSGGSISFTAAPAFTIGGAGGNGPYGGGAGSVSVGSGGRGGKNGGGGSGGSNTNASTTADTNRAGDGGAAGGWAHAYVNSPASTYAISIGATASGGSGGTNGSGGGGGSPGKITIIEHYQ